MSSASILTASASNLQTGARLALLGMIVNVAFAVVKIAAGVFGNAYALIADGIESALDVAGSIVIWAGLRLPRDLPTKLIPMVTAKLNRWPRSSSRSVFSLPRCCSRSRVREQSFRQRTLRRRLPCGCWSALSS